MKLFMMPHTVPNRPTKGAVAPMVASTPVPRSCRRAGRRLDAVEARGDTLLEAALAASRASGALISASCAPRGPSRRRGRACAGERPLGGPEVRAPAQRRA